ncbi:MAG: hypothetical protein R3302_09935 [Sulfurimonadaceae bacterium]|nr:hypothetical protein [Sulfurimonadaceae bacterium]
MNHHDPYAEKRRRKKAKEDFNYNDSFLNQNINVGNYVYLPEGYETFALLIYFALIPYGVGLIVIWLFIAGGDVSSFLVLDIFTIIPVWSIGYEALAGLIMLNIIISALRFNIKKKAYMAKQEEQIKKQHKRNPSKYDILKNYSQKR